MASGIARGRLAEERKSWRKNHPHVRVFSSPISNFDPWACVYGYLIELFDCEIRVLWRSLRLGLMGL